MTGVSERAAMVNPISQGILDRLTDVDMPRLLPEPAPKGATHAQGFTIPVFDYAAVVVGSGAAGLRAAVEAKRRNVDVAVISQSAWGGTSACSGSDKQTLHTANTSGLGDNFKDMARAIRAGGAMDEDMAYIEAVGSVRAMASLQYLGLPLPQDPLGGTLRYQTDHDEVGRATSCGPRTSRLMVQVLAQEALRLAIPFFNHTTALQVLADEQAGQRRVVGILVIRPKGQTPDNPYGLAVFRCPSLVIAAGGPGELYRDSVFPNGCFGALGLALEAGVALVNLTESQFGIGTRREGFPWNLSGTYMQALPYIYSVGADAAEHNFLAQYYRNTQELVSNIFRKGYQWPFHATRMLDFGSSLIDLAITRENQAGRRVFMDFNRNPLPVPGDLRFSLSRLDPDVAAYLGKAGATQDLPIERLQHMNPLSIELYLRYKVDIRRNPLEFAVNNQHMNGGIAVDTWGRSSLSGLYAIGEAAGTHGVTRPGGAALNAGQVLGTRVGEHLGALGVSAGVADAALHVALDHAIGDVEKLLRPESPLTLRAIKTQVQARMSDHAGILCSPENAATALSEARALNHAIAAQGISFQRKSEIARVVQWQQMALASEAVLSALDHYIRAGGGSRGARAICDPAGDALPMSKSGPLHDVRFRSERAKDKEMQIVVQRVDGQLSITTRAVRRFDEDAKPFFERDWPAWLTGAVYNLAQDRQQ